MAYEHRYYVYILASRRNGTLYVGVTNDVILRTIEHKNGQGSLFVKKYGVTRLVWWREYSDVGVAIRDEKRIKRWRRAWKIALIEEHNPRRIDLHPSLCGALAA